MTAKTPAQIATDIATVIDNTGSKGTIGANLRTLVQDVMDSATRDDGSEDFGSLVGTQTLDFSLGGKKKFRRVTLSGASVLSWTLPDDGEYLAEINISGAGRYAITVPQDANSKRPLIHVLNRTLVPMKVIGGLLFYENPPAFVVNELSGLDSLRYLNMDGHVVRVLNKIAGGPARDYVYDASSSATISSPDVLGGPDLAVLGTPVGRWIGLSQPSGGGGDGAVIGTFDVLGSTATGVGSVAGSVYQFTGLDLATYDYEIEFTDVNSDNWFFPAWQVGSSGGYYTTANYDTQSMGSIAASIATAQRQAKAAFILGRNGTSGFVHNDSVKVFGKIRFTLSGGLVSVKYDVSGWTSSAVLETQHGHGRLSTFSGSTMDRIKLIFLEAQSQTISAAKARIRQFSRAVA